MATINLIDIDNGKTIQANVGDEIIIMLIWSPSTGFYWSDSDTTGCKLQSVRSEGIGEPKPGSLARVFFTFLVQSVGFIQLNYARPWEENTPPAKWWRVEIGLGSSSSSSSS